MVATTRYIKNTIILSSNSYTFRFLYSLDVGNPQLGQFLTKKEQDELIAGGSNNLTSEQ